MADLVAIVRATRASASALVRTQKHRATAAACFRMAARYRAKGDLQEAAKAENEGNRFANAALAAEVAFNRAQRVLAVNPLPGDVR